MAVLKACAKAVHDFLDQRNITVDLQKIDAAGVWWREESDKQSFTI